MKINSKVVSDKFDNEVVVVNLETGFYYSFRSTALLIWDLLQDEATKEEIVNSFNSLSDVQLKEVHLFIDQLKEETLIVESTKDTITSSAPVVMNDFVALEFSKFEDMADLIMIDPIHDADETKGWPNLAE